MRQWWVRPAVRLGAALLLPVAVPLIITLLIWALPGDPASIICPPESCGGTDALAERWHLDEGPMGFFGHWLGNALQGDLGQSWRFIQGESVAVLIEEAVPTTLLLIALAFVPILLGRCLAPSMWSTAAPIRCCRCWDWSRRSSSRWPPRPSSRSTTGPRTSAGPLASSAGARRWSSGWRTACSGRPHGDPGPVPSGGAATVRGRHPPWGAHLREHPAERRARGGRPVLGPGAAHAERRRGGGGAPHQRAGGPALGGRPGRTSAWSSPLRPASRSSPARCWPSRRWRRRAWPSTSDGRRRGSLETRDASQDAALAARRRGGGVPRDAARLRRDGAGASAGHRPEPAVCGPRAGGALFGADGGGRSLLHYAQQGAQVVVVPAVAAGLLVGLLAVMGGLLRAMGLADRLCGSRPSARSSARSPGWWSCWSWRWCSPPTPAGSCRWR